MKYLKRKKTKKDRDRDSWEGEPVWPSGNVLGW